MNPFLCLAYSSESLPNSITVPALKASAASCPLPTNNETNDAANVPMRDLDSNKNDSVLYVVSNPHAFNES